MSPARKKPVKRKAKTPSAEVSLLASICVLVKDQGDRLLKLEKRLDECAYDIARVEDKHRADMESVKAQLMALEGRPPPRVALEGPLNLGPSELMPAPEDGQGGTDFQESSTEGATHGQ